MKDKAQRGIEEAERRKRRNAPRSFYHATPYRLKVGTHLRPRWSGTTATMEFDQCPHAVWMCSSPRTSRAIAADIVDSLRRGAGGLAGTSFFNVPDELQRVRGCWIYRVLPTGPLAEGGWRGYWSTAFPVRILEEFDSWGSPEKNELPAQPPMSAREVAKQVWDGHSWEGRMLERDLRDAWELFTTDGGRDEEALRAHFDRNWIGCPTMVQYIPSSRWKSELFSIILRSGDFAHVLDLVARCLERHFLEDVEYLKAERRKWHRKLSRDSRYKRRRRDWREE